MLVPRLKVQADSERAEVAAVLDAFAHYAERLADGQNGGVDCHAMDSYAMDRLQQVLIAQFRRAPNVTERVVVQRHNCPHVAGLAEPSWQACTSAPYDYSETVI